MNSVKGRILDYESEYGTNIYARRAYNHKLRGGVWWNPRTWLQKKKEPEPEPEPKSEPYNAYYNLIPGDTQPMPSHVYVQGNSRSATSQIPSAISQIPSATSQIPSATALTTYRSSPGARPGFVGPRPRYRTLKPSSSATTSPKRNVPTDGTITIPNNGTLGSQPFSNHCMTISLIHGLVNTGCVNSPPTIAQIRQIMDKNSAAIPGTNEEFEIDGNNHDDALDNVCVHYNVYVDFYHVLVGGEVKSNSIRYPKGCTLNASIPIRRIDVLYKPGHFEYILYSPAIRMPGKMFQKHTEFKEIYSSMESEKSALERELKSMGVSVGELHTNIARMFSKTPTSIFFVRSLPLANIVLCLGVLHQLVVEGQRMTSLTEDDVNEMLNNLNKLQDMWLPEKHRAFEVLLKTALCVKMDYGVKDIKIRAPTTQKGTYREGKYTFIRS